MIKTIGLFFLAAALTYLAVPVTLAIYFKGTGFQGSEQPLIFTLLIPLIVIVAGVWLIAIKQYKRMTRENK